LPELRRDPVDGRWVIISTGPQKRKVDFHTNKYEGKGRGKGCPFCPGRESMTPGEILAFRETGTAPNSPGWRVRVIPNKFPALVVEGELNREGVGYYDKMNGIGAHEIIIESPRHEDVHASLSLKQLEEVFTAYRERIIDLHRDKRFKYVMVFKNYGEAAGAGMEHPHSQLIAIPILPKQIIEETNGSKEYYGYKERCIFCDIIQQELEQEDRIIAMNEGFLAVCPWAPKFPFEIWILPRHHDSSYEDSSNEQFAQLAQVISEVHKRLDAALDRPHYNTVLHTSPFEIQYNDYYHWHIEIMPRITRVAGFEYGTGFYINPVPPEEAAQFLREAEIS
jgi:UDPglucose--hexose-1-phosphate uridylyltransferase